MLGNVQEWTHTAWGSRKEAAEYVYPFDARDGREDGGESPAGAALFRVHRGGSYRDARNAVRCAARGASAADSRLRWRGFRVAMDVT
jgi:formylglycine-generating enzyme required for sulfatase activity